MSILDGMMSSVQYVKYIAALRFAVLNTPDLCKDVQVQVSAGQYPSLLMVSAISRTFGEHSSYFKLWRRLKTSTLTESVTQMSCIQYSLSQELRTSWKYYSKPNNAMDALVKETFKEQRSLEEKAKTLSLQYGQPPLSTLGNNLVQGTIIINPSYKSHRISDASQTSGVFRMDQIDLDQPVMAKQTVVFGNVIEGATDSTLMRLIELINKQIKDLEAYQGSSKVEKRVNDLAKARIAVLKQLDK